MTVFKGSAQNRASGRSSGLWRDEMRDSMNWSIGKRRFWLNSRIAGFWLARSCERVETRR